MRPTLFKNFPIFDEKTFQAEITILKLAEKYPERIACKIWLYKNCILSIFKNSFDVDTKKLSKLICDEWYCGYARIYDKWIDEKDAESCVDCHGGITYYEEDHNSVVIGFDCHHAGDNHRYDLKNENIIIKEVELMVDSYYECYNNLLLPEEKKE